MAGVRDLYKNEEFRGLAPEVRSTVFDRLAVDDAEFQGLTPDVQAKVREKLGMTVPAGPSGSTWRDRLFKTGAETLADPNATGIERFLGGVTEGMRGAARAAGSSPEIPTKIAEYATLPFSVPFAGITRGLEEGGVISPRTTEQLEKSLIGATPAFMALRPKSGERLRSAEIPESIRPVEPVPPPRPAVAREAPAPLSEPPAPSIPEPILRAIQPRPPLLTAKDAIAQELTGPTFAVGDPVEFIPRPHAEPLRGTITNVNADGSLNLRSPTGGLFQRVDPAKVTTPIESVGTSSRRIGRRLSVSEEDWSVLDEVERSLKDVQAEPTLGRKFTVDRSMESAEAAPSALEVKGYATGKPPWMEIEGKPGEYYGWDETLEVLGDLKKGKWPTSARRERIAEVAMDEVKLGAAEAKGKIGSAMDEALGSGTRPAPLSAEDAPAADFFRSVDELSAAEQGRGPVPEGYVRLYRGETPPRTAEGAASIANAPFEPPEFRGRWFTEDRSIAERYTGAKSQLVYVDVPQSVADATRVSKHPEAIKASFQPETEYVLPAEWAQKTLPAVKPAPSAPPAIVDPILSWPVHKQIVAAAEDLFTTAGIKRDPGRLISDQIMDLLGEGRLRLPDLDTTLKAHGVSWVDMANGLFRPGVRDAARRLGYLGNLQKRIGALLAEGGEAAKAEAGQLLDFATTIDETAKAQSWWRRADNIRRGLLVTQLSTAVRNFETQVGRVGLDVLQQGLDAGLQRVFTPSNATVHPADGFATLLNIFRRGTKATTEKILSAFPREHDRLFGTYASDIANKAKQSGVVLRGADAAFSNVEQAVGVLNTANKFQEWLVRRAVFQTKLDQILRTKGQDLTQLIAENKIGAIDPAAIKAAVDAALEMTFAKSPQYGGPGQKFISFVNAMPGATLAIPFPRFLVNSLKFFGDFSPFGFLKLLSPAERAAVASGNMQTISRATLGTALLGAAYQFRNSEYSGERWYEARLPDGRTIDLRPFNPFAAYLFVADVAKRYKEGKLEHLTGGDIASGVLSANVRAGTGLFIIDKLLSGLTRTGNAEQALRSLKELAGETVGGLLTPLQQVTDVLSEFDRSLRLMRDTRSEPFKGPIKARIPGLAQTLPERESPTRAATPERQAPILKQATGILLNAPKNPLEAELDRLGFTPQEILPGTGDRELNRLIAQKMGPIAERFLVPLVSGAKYQALDDDVKGVVLKKVLGRIATAARQSILAERPDFALRQRLQHLPARERALIQSRIPDVIQRAVDAQRGSR
jgi:hypothetical protein